MSYRSTKTFDHSLGLSCCFRQWRATHSHCSKLHGYALSFKFTFECDELDERNWCVDFGGLKQLKERLQHYFDHRLVVAQDDPDIDVLCSLSGLGIADTFVLPAVGCEQFAKFAWETADNIIRISGMADRVRVVSCECAEHGANSAIYIHDQK